MNRELHLKVVYENNLDTDKFARMFNQEAPASIGGGTFTNYY